MADRPRPHLPALIFGMAFTVAGALGIVSTFASVDWSAAVALSLLGGGAATLFVFVARRASASSPAPD